MTRHFDRRHGLVAVCLLAACASRASVSLPERFTDVVRYREARARLIEKDRSRRLGAGIVFTPAEESANRRLMALKQAELDRTRSYFPPAHSFLDPKTKQAIDASPVFEVMRRLPKGGILHAHGSATGNFRWLVDNATYRPDAYMYMGSAASIVRGALRIAEQSPGEGWRPIRELRAAAADAKAFDDAIYRSITLGEEEIGGADIWEEFGNCFRRTAGLFNVPGGQAGYWRALFEGLIADNVQYLESRTPPIDVALVRVAQARDPAFNVKFIPISGRSAGRDRVAQILAGVVDPRATDPERVKGFDLVEEEDRTNTNLFYIDELLAARQAAERRGVTLPLYLHSGESNRAENENLYDAVLLGALRIGHGLALIKHPLLMDIVRERKVAVEICPISNQILGFVSDLRTHPAAHYISSGMTVVLSPDDPAIFKHTFSHDFYVAFMAWGLDLRDLKQLAMSSLLHSAMDPGEKEQALAAWRGRWASFIDWLNQPSAGG